MIMMATLKDNDNYHGHNVIVVLLFKCIYQIIFPLIYVLIVMEMMRMMMMKELKE